MKIVVTIPAHDEESRVALAVRDALQYGYTVVVIDDCSQDKTAEVAKEAGAIVLRHIINRGQGAALQTGMDYAMKVLQADIVVHFDADGQMRGEEIALLTEPLMRGEADVALGSRFMGKPAKDMPLWRLVALRFAVLFTMAISGIRVTDTHNGFRALSRRAVEEVRITLDRMAHASEILDLIKAKRLRYVERPVTIIYTPETIKKGQSTWRAVGTAKDILKKKFVG